MDLASRQIRVQPVANPKAERCCDRPVLSDRGSLDTGSRHRPAAAPEGGLVAISLVRTYVEQSLDDRLVRRPDVDNALAPWERPPCVASPRGKRQPGRPALLAPGWARARHQGRVAPACGSRGPRLARAAAINPRTDYTPQRRFVPIPNGPPRAVAGGRQGGIMSNNVGVGFIALLLFAAILIITQRCPPRSAALLTPAPPLAAPSFGVSRPRRT